MNQIDNLSIHAGSVGEFDGVRFISIVVLFIPI